MDIVCIQPNVTRKLKSDLGRVENKVVYNISIFSLFSTIFSNAFFLVFLNSSPNNKVLSRFQLKAFADDNIINLA